MSLPLEVIEVIPAAVWTKDSAAIGMIGIFNHYNTIVAPVSSSTVGQILNRVGVIHDSIDDVCQVAEIVGTHIVQVFFARMTTSDLLTETLVSLLWGKETPRPNPLSRSTIFPMQFEGCLPIPPMSVYVAFKNL